MPEGLANPVKSRLPSVGIKTDFMPILCQIYAKRPKKHENL